MQRVRVEELRRDKEGGDGGGRVKVKYKKSGLQPTLWCCSFGIGFASEDVAPFQFAWLCSRPTPFLPGEGGTTPTFRPPSRFGLLLQCRSDSQNVVRDCPPASIHQASTLLASLACVSCPALCDASCFLLRILSCALLKPLFCYRVAFLLFLSSSVSFRSCRTGRALVPGLTNKGET